MLEMALPPTAATGVLSLWSLFWQADWVVKGVIFALGIASVWTWSILVSKTVLLRKLHQEADDLSHALEETPLEHHGTVLRSPHTTQPFTQLLILAAQEWRHLQANNLIGEHRARHHQRLEHLMSIQLEEQREALMDNMGVLSSIGSTAAFVGLFGTVWGIMNSFQAIATHKDSGLAVVAPGIAEALFATAIGLIVAIPAVIGYNRLSLNIHSYMVRLELFAQELSAKCLQ